MTAPRLAWSRHGDRWLASCGDRQQGFAVVRRQREGWTFVLDMLPLDAEPLVVGDTYLTPERAQAEAARQMQAWPSLIEGARRV
jgi:hypothetical protein